MKIYIFLCAATVTSIAGNNQHQSSNWSRQNIRSNSHIIQLSSSSDSAEQSFNILKTEIYNPDNCILIPEPTSDEIQQFHQWATQNNKRYSSDSEQSCRMINVIDKLRDIHAHNQRFEEGKESFTRTLNNLSDLTRKELENRLLIDDISVKGVLMSGIEMLQAFPDPRPSVDYRDENLVSPVQHQGKCGSCWAFSTAAVLEGQLRKCGISQEIVSPQNYLDCTPLNYNACNGANPIYAFEYAKTGGILPAAQYPYFGKENQCVFNKSDIIGYVNTTFRFSLSENSQTEVFMRKIISSVGPISAIMYVDKNFENYAAGIYSSSSTCKNNPPNHAVTIIGYGTDPKFGDYWLVKNSWGAKWGENGYVRFARGNNMCLIESQIYYAQIETKDGKICKLETNK